MREDQFIKENIILWKNLENTLLKLKSKGFKKFEKDELDDFMAAYNLTCGHLSYSRTYFGNTETTNYLNRLVASAHSYIYTINTLNFRKIFKFFLLDFPLLIRQNMGYFVASTSLFFIGIIFSYIFTLISVDNAPAFMPQALIDGLNNFGKGNNSWDGAIASSEIFTNNIKVGFLSFAFGITLGIGTIYVLVFNGFMLGGAAALAQHNKITVDFWALILPHGVLELFSIFVCGAAGLLIASAIIRPGIYSRKDSLIKKGKTAIILVIGTIPLFVIAGLIEGFLTPSALPVEAKLGFALITLIFIVFYLFSPNLWKRVKDTYSKTLD